VDFRQTQLGRAPAINSDTVEREFLDRVAHAESLNDITVAAHIALHSLVETRPA